MSDTITHLEVEVASATKSWGAQIPSTLRLGRESTVVDGESSAIETADSEVEVYAVVTSRREGRSGVQSLGKFSIKDLYYGAESPVIEFRDAIESIYQLCSDTLRRADDLVTLNTGAVKIWMLICELRSLLGKISSGHDEVMATLIAVAVKSKLEPIDAVRLRGLQAASGIVRNKVRFSVETLDAFEDALERAGFDLGIPLAEDGNG